MSRSKTGPIALAVIGVCGVMAGPMVDVSTTRLLLAVMLLLFGLALCVAAGHVQLLQVLGRVYLEVAAEELTRCLERELGRKRILVTLELRRPGQREPGQREPGQREPGQHEPGNQEAADVFPRQLPTDRNPTNAISATATRCTFHVARDTPTLETRRGQNTPNLVFARRSAVISRPRFSEIAASGGPLLHQASTSAATVARRHAVAAIFCNRLCHDAGAALRLQHFATHRGIPPTGPLAMDTPTSSYPPYSADVSMQMHVDGDILEIGQLGPDFVILDDTADHPPGAAVIVLSIDGRQRSWTVQLPDGIIAGKSETRIALSKKPGNTAS